VIRSTTRTNHLLLVALPTLTNMSSKFVNNFLSYRADRQSIKGKNLRNIVGEVIQVSRKENATCDWDIVAHQIKVVCSALFRLILY